MRNKVIPTGPSDYSSGESNINKQRKRLFSSAVHPEIRFRTSVKQERRIPPVSHLGSQNGDSLSAQRLASQVLHLEDRYTNNDSLDTTAPTRCSLTGSYLQGRYSNKYKDQIQ